MLQGRLNGCLAAFAEVDDRVELWEVRRCKRNKLYREYEEAVKLAKMILRRYDNSIDRASAEEHAIPAFWIDMSLLYEHYVLGALRKAYGSKIVYQANVTTGKPDFLYADEKNAGTSMYCVKGESEKTLHRGDFKRKHHYRGCILPRVRVQ